MGHQPTGVLEAIRILCAGLNVPGARRQSQRKREERARETARYQPSREGPEGVTLDPWPLHLRGCSRLGEGRGDHGPKSAASTTTVQRPAGLFPPPRHGFRDPVACPQVPCHACLSLSPSVSLGEGGPSSQFPQMPAAIFVFPFNAPPPLPSLLSHCDGTRGGKRGKAAARKVSLPVLGGVVGQRCLEGV